MKTFTTRMTVKEGHACFDLIIYAMPQRLSSVVTALSCGSKNVLHKLCLYSYSDRVCVRGSRIHSTCWLWPEIRVSQQWLFKNDVFKKSYAVIIWKMTAMFTVIFAGKVLSMFSFRISRQKHGLLVARWKYCMCLIQALSQVGHHHFTVLAVWRDERVFSNTCQKLVLRRQAFTQSCDRFIHLKNTHRSTDTHAAWQVCDTPELTETTPVAWN